LRPDGTARYEGRLWLYQPTKLLPRRVDRHADARLASGVMKAAARVGFRHPLLWVNDPSGATLLDAAHWPALYDITDDWLAADRATAELERTRRSEELLLERCGEVVVCSEHLTRSKGRGRAVTLIPNGVDLAAYRQIGPRPAALTDGRVALYVGTLHRDRLDVGLCVATSLDLRGQGHLVLAGPQALPGADVQRLAAAGVVLLGRQDRSAVPALLQHADVLVVPHVVSAFTDSLDPIKLYEYAAAGRPVVSTPVAGFRDDTSGRVTVAEGPAFVTEVLRVLESGWATSIHLPEDARADWGNRVAQMAAVLARLETA
jgi:glycosyltransferase involved in cell wall biosynthesis